MGLNLRRKFSDDDKIKILQEGYKAFVSLSTYTNTVPP